MTMKKYFLMVFFAALTIVPALGQGNRPTKELTQREREAAYKKGLELDQIPRGAIELELKDVLPSDKEIEEGEIFFRMVLRFAIDDRGHIYIPDGVLGVVYELNTMGKLVHSFRKRGQGPGEMQSPGYVFPFKQQVIVFDGLSMRMNYFDRDWKYVRSFSIFKGGSPFASASDGRFYCSDRSGERLISVLDAEGKLIDSFGDKPSKMGSTLNQFILGVSPGGSIWVGMIGLGRLIKYSSLGRLEKEIDLVEISSQWIKDRLKENYQYARQGEQKSFVLLQAIAFVGEDVLAMNGGIRQPIFRFDSEGHLKNAYHIQPRMGVNLLYFQVRAGENGQARFYILHADRESGDRRIGVYGRKK
jgi:hypothetical protein